MYSVSAQLYGEAVRAFRASVEGENYYSAVLRFTHAGVSCCMRLSAMLFYTEVVRPEGKRRVVSDLTPVWWEFHTSIDGVEELNDFTLADFADLLRSTAH